MAEIRSIIGLRGRHFVRHHGICNQICVKTSTTYVRCHNAQFNEDTKSLYQYMAELQPIIMFNGRHFVRHLGICNPICVKLL